MRVKQNETAGRWETLCEQAAGEQDPKKLLELVKEINRLLADKQRRPDSESDQSMQVLETAEHRGVGTGPNLLLSSDIESHLREDLSESR
jgi:hypothetical protein